MGRDQVARQGAGVVREVDVRQVPLLVDLCVNQGHAPNPVLAVLEGRPGPLVLHAAGLEAQEAGGHLEVVLDPVVDFPQEGLLLPEGGGQAVLALAHLPVGQRDDRQGAREDHGDRPQADHDPEGRGVPLVQPRGPECDPGVHGQAACGDPEPLQLAPVQDHRGGGDVAHRNGSGALPPQDPQGHAAGLPVPQPFQVTHSASSPRPRAPVGPGSRQKITTSRAFPEIRGRKSQYGEIRFSVSGSIE